MSENARTIGLKHNNTPVKSSRRPPAAALESLSDVLTKIKSLQNKMHNDMTIEEYDEQANQSMRNQIAMRDGFPIEQEETSSEQSGTDSTNTTTTGSSISATDTTSSSRASTPPPPSPPHAPLVPRRSKRLMNKKKQVK